MGKHHTPMNAHCGQENCFAFLFEGPLISRWNMCNYPVATLAPSTTHVVQMCWLCCPSQFGVQGGGPTWEIPLGKAHISKNSHDSHVSIVSEGPVSILYNGLWKHGHRLIFLPQCVAECGGRFGITLCGPGGRYSQCSMSLVILCAVVHGSGSTKLHCLCRRCLFLKHYMMPAVLNVGIHMIPIVNFCLRVRLLAQMESVVIQSSKIDTHTHIHSQTHAHTHTHTHTHTHA